MSAQPKLPDRCSIPARRCACAAFTLLEVLLALAIAVGLLLVVLHFYHQAADLRTQLLVEAERIAATRLIMDRLTADLRAACTVPGAGLRLSGGPASLRLVMRTPPSRAAWTGGHLGRAAFAETDLKWVSYSVSSVSEGTNRVVTGLVRTEEPCVESRPLNAARQPGQDSPEAIENEPPAPEPLSDAIRFARFRYWNGSGWAASWSGSGLPTGVEVTLAAEPPAENAPPGEEPAEVFRRVIYLPAGGADAGEAALSASEETILWSEEEMP